MVSRDYCVGELGGGGVVFGWKLVPRALLLAAGVAWEWKSAGWKIGEATFGFFVQLGGKGCRGHVAIFRWGDDAP